MLTGCGNRSPVKIGLIADFSGRGSHLGPQARNAMVMAIDELNSRNGINGREVELIYRDHKNDSEICQREVREMIDAGAVVIFGPMVSGMALAVIEAAAPTGTLVIGSTVSTDILTGLDDNFIRGVAPASFQGKYLSRVIRERELRQIIFVMDSRNKEYSDGVVSGFVKDDLLNEGRIAGKMYFDEKDDIPLLVQNIRRMMPDGLIFLASGIDSSAIIQLYARDYPLPDLFGGSWPKVTEIEKYAGKLIDGMIFFDTPKNNIPLERERKFYDKYGNLFNAIPNIAAIHTYESVNFYARAVEESGSFDSNKVKAAIISMDEIEGVYDTFSIDRFGDGKRSMGAYILKDGSYELYPFR